MSRPHPRCVVIAGPNGAGKSTHAPRLLGGLYDVGRYVNVDTLASGLAGFTPSAAEAMAGRLAIEAIDTYIARRVDFAFETTLSGKRWPRLLSLLDAEGFDVVLHYLWVPSPAFSLLRVRERVSLGGHAVPEEAIMRRWRASVENLVHVWLPTARLVRIVDGSVRRHPSLIKVHHV